MSGASAEIIEDTERLGEIAPEWWRLWQAIPDALPFLSPAWLIPWWRHFAPGRLFTIAVRRDGELVGLAPGYIEQGPLGRRILPLGISLSDHLDVLADPQHRPDVLAELAAAAADHGDAWDIWELEQLQPGAAALDIPLPDGCTDQTEQQDAVPFVALPASGSGSGAALPRSKRQNLNLARNRAARRGEVSIAIADPNNAPDFLEHLFRLHEVRWRNQGGAGVLAPDAVQAFQRDAVPGLQSAGLLRLYTLSIAGQVVAAQYDLLQPSRLSVYLTGFDPGYAYESPSVILLAHAIETALAEGRREVDFLRGREPYKYEWGAVDRWNLKRSIRRAS